MAAEGARDQTLFRLACALAEAYPTGNARGLVELSMAVSSSGGTEGCDRTKRTTRQR
jgi:hypothetical protein